TSRASALGAGLLALAAVAAASPASAAAASASAAPAVTIATRALLARLARRRVLRTLDELLRRDDPAVLVLLHDLEPDAPARLVDLLHEHVEDVAALDDVLDVVDATRADVRHVQQPVGALLQLHERAEVGRLDDLARVLVADLRLLRERGDRGDRRVRLLALGRVDENRPVLLDVDLHL